MKQTGLITGASSGIGKELARIHAGKGRDVILVARSEDKLNTLKDELEKDHGIEAMVYPMDLSKEENIHELYQELESTGVEVEYLFNNAAFGDFGLYHENGWDKERRMIDLNVKSLTCFTKLFGTAMVKRKKGWIMNVASTAAFQPGPLMSVYYATKSYVLVYSEGIAHEWKDFGVKVSVLCPGPTESGFQQEADMEGSKLFSRMKPASAKSVAMYGYRSLEKGKTVAIHGLLNKIGALSIRFSPRSLVPGIVRKVQEKK